MWMRRPVSIASVPIGDPIELEELRMRARKPGFTLVEVLVVIAIVVVLLTIMIPRVRVINRDRKVREAARVVASAITRAAQRAAVGGEAGIFFERNLNFRYSPPTARDLAGLPIAVPYAVNRIHQMQAVEPFSGDFLNDRAEVIRSDNGNVMVKVPRPLSMASAGTGQSDFLGDGATIFLEGRSYGYGLTDVIAEVTTPTTEFPNGSLTLQMASSESGRIEDAGSSFPPPANGKYRFRIERAPRRVEGAMVELPRGYIIDLRYSGSVVSDGLYPETDLASFTTTDDTFVKLFISDVYKGWQGRSRIEYGIGFDPCTGNETVVLDERGPFVKTTFFLITEFDPETKRDPLTDPDSLWVTVDPNGIVNVAAIVPQRNALLDTSTQEESRDGFAKRLEQSRAIARQKLSALQ